MSKFPLKGLAAGLIAGTISAIWGYYKDVIYAGYEEFKPLSFIRSPIAGAIGGVVFQLYGVEDPLVLLFCAGASERIIVEPYKIFIKQSIPSKFKFEEHGTPPEPPPETSNGLIVVD